jgi:Holliday junction resolvase
MGATSRRKGREGENELRKLWAGAGWDCVAAQRNLGGGQGDVRARKYPLSFHIECKRSERLSVPEWIRQAESEAASGDVPIVCYRQNKGGWYAIVRLDDLLGMLP